MALLPDLAFWSAIDRLVAGSRLVIDRPRGSPHPRYPDMIYPLDYGYLEGTKAADGSGIDFWTGSLEDRQPNAIILTVDLHKRDAELKILLGCSETEMKSVLSFLNSGSMHAALVRRESDGVAWLSSRRSVRRFLPEPVPEELLRRVLEVSTWAPSAHNRQPWRFAVLTTAGSKTRLSRAMGADFRRDLLADGLPVEEVDAQVERSHRRIEEAPVVALLCLDMSVMDSYPDDRRQEAERLMAVQSVAMAGENLLLAAHREGLGGVWVCAPLFAQETVRRALDLPETWEPQGLVLLGFPAKIPEPRPRRPLEEVTRFL